MRTLGGKPLSLEHHPLWHVHLLSSSTIGDLNARVSRVSCLLSDWLTFHPHLQRPKQGKFTSHSSCYPLVIISPSLPSTSLYLRTESFNLAFFFLSGFLWIKSEHGRRTIFSKVTHSCKGNPQRPTIDIASFSSVTLNKYI